MKGILKCKVSRKELLQAHKEKRQAQSEYSFQKADIDIDYDGLARVFAEAIVERGVIA